MKRILRVGALASLGLIAALGASCSSDDNKKTTGGELADGGTSTGSDPSAALGDGGSGSQTGNTPTGQRDGATNQSGRGNSPRARQVCPAAAPGNGESCVAGRGDCEFGTVSCDCDEDTSEWTCFDTAQCPATAPAELDGCAPLGLECEYDNVVVDGERDNLDCECSITGWDCERQVCPVLPPASGDNCSLAILGRSSGDGLCEYEADVCDCRGGTWSCWKPSDCPAAAPARTSACMVQGMVCGYPTGECECGRRGWQCEGRSNSGNRRDGGARSDAGPSDAGSDDGGSTTQPDVSATPDAAL